MMFWERIVVGAGVMGCAGTIVGFRVDDAFGNNDRSLLLAIGAALLVMLPISMATIMWAARSKR